MPEVKEKEEVDEFTTALDILFDSIEKACKEAGLHIQIEYECDEPGEASMAMWLEHSMVVIYGGEINFINSRRQYKRFLRWAQIEGARSVSELAEGLASDDTLMREKAQRKKKELNSPVGAKEV